MNSNENPPSQLVDEEGALKRLGGDRSLFDEFISIFLEDSPELLSEIRQGLKSDDANAVGKNAHSLKGLMSNFGAKECVEVALKIELAGRAGEVAECDDDFQRLEHLHGQLASELKSLR